MLFSSMAKEAVQMSVQFCILGSSLEKAGTDGRGTGTMFSEVTKKKGTKKAGSGECMSVRSNGMPPDIPFFLSHHIPKKFCSPLCVITWNSLLLR